jgi:hypothetical protein
MHYLSGILPQLHRFCLIEDELDEMNSNWVLTPAEFSLQMAVKKEQQHH